MQVIQFILLAVFTLLSCQTATNKNDSSSNQIPHMKRIKVSESDFGNTPEGFAKLFTLSNQNGMKVQITNFGGIVTSIYIPDRHGNSSDVVLGFDNLSDYLNPHPYFGAIIGRYGNRIAKGEFKLDGQSFSLPINNGPNSLHGGNNGFDKHLWNSKILAETDLNGIELSRLSPDGEEGYPGNMAIKVRYVLTDNNELRIEYEATTDQLTVCNLTNHSYFNLSGAGNGDILSHELMIKADNITPVDETLIPTGNLMHVENTAFDFRKAYPIGARIQTKEEQLIFGGGYDHNFVLDRQDDSMEVMASAYDPDSGRYLEVITTEPGIQFYSGNFLDGTNIGKNGLTYSHRYGFCLETQHFPDSPNQDNFPSTDLKPGEIYQSTTIYRFSIK